MMSHAWIDGSERKGREYFDVLDPASGACIAQVPELDRQDVDDAVAAARRSFEEGVWANLAPKVRSRTLRRLSDLILSNSDELAQLESLDTGKPLSQAISDVEVAARYFEFYAGCLENFGGITIPATPGILAYTRREPLGVTAHIEPWNYPLQIGSRSVAPSLAVGNSVVLKPAEEAPLSLLRLARLGDDAGLPAGVFNVVTGAGETIGAYVAEHSGIDHLSFTGSVPVGSLVAQAAARRVIPSALELGGKSPNIVFADADLDRSIPIIARSILQNAGQTCSAGSRLLVDASVYDLVVGRLANHFAEVRIGRGSEDPDLGPLISAGQLARLERLLEQGLDGAVVAAGGTSVMVKGCEGGNFFAPTLVAGVDPRSSLAQEELFGPVVTAMAFADEQEALSIANGTRFGLIAAVWTQDLARAHRVAAHLRCGQVYVNAYGAGGGVELPFGGVKESGYGREKGAEALQAFSHVKTVAVATE